MGNRDSFNGHVQEVEGEEVDSLLKCRLGWKLEVLLLEFASLRVLVTEDEVDLWTRP